MRLLTIIFLFVFANAYGQSPYTFDWKKEPLYLGLGLGTGLSGIAIQSNMSILSEKDIFLLDRQNIPAFDRRATFNYSTRAGHASDVFFGGSALLPTLLLIPKNTRNHYGQVALLYLESILITGGVTQLTKTVIKRPRPYVFNESVDLARKTRRQARFSFFSGHTSVTASNFFLTAKLFADFHPESKWKPYVWAVAITAPAVTGYLRVKAGKHYSSDVIAGYFIGALSGYLIPQLHKNSKDANWRIVPGSNGGIGIHWNLD